MRSRTIALAASFLVLLACGPGGSPPDDVDPPQVEAPGPIALPLTHDSLLTLILRSPCDEVPPPPAVTQALTGGETFENEIHDCQRLVMPGNVFGPLVGVFPLDEAMTLNDREFGQPRVVATVFKWEHQQANLNMYPPLRIRMNWHCLWLVNRNGGWQAEITPTTAPCAIAPGEPPSSFPLAVAYASAPRAGGIPFPATARWGWDDAADTHYIGIRCGTGWCSIGAQGLNPQRSRLADAIGLRLPNGWYDEEHLAIPGPAGLVPGPWGIVYPADSLVRAALHVQNRDPARAARAVEEYNRLFSSRLRAARIAVEGRVQSDVAPYDQKFNLAHDAPAWRTDVELQLGQSVRAWFNSGTSRVETSNVAYLETMRHGATGTVRWRWQETDQTVWISCRSGCCDVQES